MKVVPVDQKLSALQERWKKKVHCFDEITGTMATTPKDCWVRVSVMVVYVSVKLSTAGRLQEQSCLFRQGDKKKVVTPRSCPEFEFGCSWFV
jgi:hypothetical protein